MPKFLPNEYTPDCVRTGKTKTFVNELIVFIVLFHSVVQSTGYHSLYWRAWSNLRPNADGVTCAETTERISTYTARCSGSKYCPDLVKARSAEHYRCNHFRRAIVADEFGETCRLYRIHLP